MEEICSSKTSVDTQRNTRRYIPEDGTLHNHHCENLKSCVQMMFINLFIYLLIYKRLKTQSMAQTLEIWMRSLLLNDELQRMRKKGGRGQMLVALPISTRREQSDGHSQNKLLYLFLSSVSLWQVSNY
jgi:hypothetical protein